MLTFACSSGTEVLRTPDSIADAHANSRVHRSRRESVNDGIRPD
jgi:hypothetical protein